MRNTQKEMWAWRARRWLAPWLLPLLLLVVWASVGLLTPANPYRWQEEQLREAIMGSMKCPVTASIGPITFRSEPDGRFLVASGWVDGQNSFGAMIRQSYEAWFAEVVDGEPKRLISFKWEKH